MNHIYIIGASGLAKEVATYILDCKIFSIVAFIDKTEPAIDSMRVREKSYRVISEVDFIARCKKERSSLHTVIAVGYPEIRRQIFKKFEPFCDFPNIIHPSSFCQSLPKIGIGNIIAPYTMLSVDIIIGNFNLINYGTTIGHDTVIGDFNVILPQNIISGNVVIGSRNLFGAGTSVIEKISIGNVNTIGMGSVCVESIGNNGLLMGVPARHPPPPPHTYTPPE
jgi:sugar O-acyltransferase (sialic acid O-acetyltransferase NeuD family)